MTKTREVAAFVALVLTFLLVPSARASFQVGIADPNPIPISDAHALGVTTSRSTLLWQGEKTFTGTLRFTPGLRPFVLVMGGPRDVPTTPALLDDYCGFIRSIMLRYPNVKDIGIWGEPSQYNHYTWPAGLPITYYAEIVKACAPVVHSLGGRVIGPQAHPMAPDLLVPILRAIKSVGRQSLDVFSIDPYWYASLMPQFVRVVRAVLGWNIPIWVAEDGIESVPDPEFRYLYEMEDQWNYTTPEADQGNVIRSHMIYAYCAGAERWNNFLLVDERKLGRWQSGLLRPDGSQKPAYAVFSQAVSDIDAGRIDCAKQPPPPPVDIPHFRKVRRDRAEAPHDGPSLWPLRTEPTKEIG